MAVLLLCSNFVLDRACVVTLEKVTPVTLVCGREEEGRKTGF
jgi:hypothetical protein